MYYGFYCLSNKKIYFFSFYRIFYVKIHYDKVKILKVIGKMEKTFYISQVRRYTDVYGDVRRITPVTCITLTAVSY